MMHEQSCRQLAVVEIAVQKLYIRTGVHLMSVGLLQLIAVRHQRRTTSTLAVGAERLPPAWSQAPVGVTTSHQCYGSCIGCQSVSACCSRLLGWYINRLLERLPRTWLTTAVFCRTLVVGH